MMTRRGMTRRGVTLLSAFIPYRTIFCLLSSSSYVNSIIVDPSSAYKDCGGIILHIGDGECDSVNNNQGCGYDGGDCCPCTCESEALNCGTFGYDCRDPNAGSRCSLHDCNKTMIPLVGDGRCDEASNNAGCAFDGGDCCACMCKDGAFTCGISGYDCRDPDAASDCSWDACTGVESYIGDGECNRENNNPQCSYDGGDCCPCTCNRGFYLPCESFARYDCKDPDAQCFDWTSGGSGRLFITLLDILPICCGVTGMMVVLFFFVAVAWRGRKARRTAKTRMDAASGSHDVAAVPFTAGTGLRRERVMRSKGSWAAHDE